MALLTASLPTGNLYSSSDIFEISWFLLQNSKDNSENEKFEKQENKNKTRILDIKKKETQKITKKEVKEIENMKFKKSIKPHKISRRLSTNFHSYMHNSRNYRSDLFWTENDKR